MREAMDINNTRTIHQIVKNALRVTKYKQWDFGQFIAMAIWKPKVKNQCIQCFIARMKEKSLSIPDSDYMEFPDNAKELNTEIDISHYLEQTMGLCSTLLTMMKDTNHLLHIKLCNSKIRMRKKSRLTHILQKKLKNGLRNISKP
ncbi:11661_t:CDS:2 [Cetraspora pellucida]|uniref:11661_t:CDS:1 n=1 Tax=Cetraspora pellucida TaxID=1433469 RepID=A0ACA9MZU6_9GLOM|nr:11661_t:CDS:2 [Cetraspora pellucida]